MREVIGVRSWIFWWAALTSTVFLQEWLRRLAGFFRDKTIFSTSGFPFNVVAGLTGLIDSAADSIRKSASFDPNGTLLKIGGFNIQNWVLALIFALILIGVVVRFYVRALASPALSDDILALIILYFVIRIIAHLIAIAQFSPLTPAGRALLDNPAITFWILIFFLVVLVFFGEGLKSTRAFWRGIIEGILVAILLLPGQAAEAVAFGIDRFADFGGVVQTKVEFGLIWGVVGMLLALGRLYRSDAPAKGKA